MSDHDVLTGRIERLERQNRALMLAVLLIVVLAAGAAAVAQRSGATTLTAQRIVLTDADGKTRAILAVESGPQLLFNDAEGKVRVELSSSPEPKLVTRDDKGREYDWFHPKPTLHPVR